MGPDVERAATFLAKRTLAHFSFTPDCKQGHTSSRSFTEMSHMLHTLQLYSYSHVDLSNVLHAYLFTHFICMASNRLKTYNCTWNMYQIYYFFFFLHRRWGLNSLYLGAIIWKRCAFTQCSVINKEYTMRSLPQS